MFAKHGSAVHGWWPACALAGALLLGSTAHAQTLPAPIAGENVNMVSGITWPSGDPFLQRQNEPSLAVSSRNPLHLLAAANDYRTVDIPSDPVARNTAEAWIGVFRSIDGGHTWKSKLLPGYPQQNQNPAFPDLEGFPNILQSYTPAGSSTPYAFTSACDPIVRAGTDGLLYVSGMVYNRTTHESATFVARYLDDGSSQEPFQYRDTQVVSLSGSGAAVALDRPFFAADVPRKMPHPRNDFPNTCAECHAMHNGQVSLVPLPSPEPLNCALTGKPAGTLYQAYAHFTDPTGQTQVSQIRVAFSRDCGATWRIQPTLGDPARINQGAAIAIDPVDGTVWVAWRQFADGSGAKDAIFISRSNDAGWSFTPVTGVLIADDIPPLDLSPSGQQFRTESIPTIAVSVDAAGNRRVHVAWSQHDAVTGDARIVMSTSQSITPTLAASTIWAGSGDGWRNLLLWSAPQPVDAPVGADGLPYARANQFMPAMTFSQGRLTLVYYDSRFDSTRRYLDRHSFLEALGPVGFLTNGDPAPIFGALFDPSSYDYDGSGNITGVRQVPWTTRHAVEVRVATALPGSAPASSPGNPVFVSGRVSKYPFGVATQPPADPNNLFDYTPSVPAFNSTLYLLDSQNNVNYLAQSQANFINLPIFKRGAMPFIGDYIDVAAPAVVPIPVPPTTDTTSLWRYGWKPNVDWVATPIHYAVWTTNQDVQFPADGDWRKYTPVKLSTQGSASLFDATSAPTFCDPAGDSDHTGTRNQNIYAARISEGLYVHSPEPIKSLDPGVTRTFVIAAQNLSGSRLPLRFCVADSNGACATSSTSGLTATFVDDFSGSPAVLAVNTSAPKESTASQTLFVRGTGLATITVNVCQIDTDIATVCKAGGYSGSVTLNPPGATAPLQDPAGSGETVTPVFLPFDPTNDVRNMNVQQMNVQQMNVQQMNVQQMNVQQMNVQQMNVQQMNVQQMNVQQMNVQQMNVQQTAVSEATYQLQNTGNTAATYVIDVGNTDSNTTIYVRASKIETVPVAAGCQVVGQPQESVVSNGIAGLDPIVVTVLPGESVWITLSANVGIDEFRQMLDSLTVSAKRQGSSTSQSVVPLQILAPLGGPATARQPFTATGSARGGRADASGNLVYTWSLCTQATCGKPSVLKARTDASGNTVWDAVTGSASAAITAAGVFSATFTEAGDYLVTLRVTDARGDSASRSLPLQVIRATTTTSVTAEDATYDGAPHGAMVTVASYASPVTVLGSELTVTYSGTAATLYGPTTIAPVNAGTYSVSASYAGTPNYVASTGAASFTIAPKPASVTPNNVTKLNGTVDPPLDGTLSGFLTSDGVTATYSRAAGETVAGSPYAITATLAPASALANYAITYNTAWFTISSKTGQTISFARPADFKVYGDPDFAVAATATSGLPVSFAASGACTMSGASLVHITMAGTCVITASQPGNAYYDAAPEQTVTVPVFNWSGLLPPIGRGAPFKAGSTIPVKFQMLDGDNAPNGRVPSTPTLTVSRVSGNTTPDEPITVVSTGAADTGNAFRYDGEAYAFNLSTKGWANGTYVLSVDIGDGILRPTSIVVKK